MLSFSQRASLDVIRAMAAFYVLLHHITPRLIDPPFLYIFKFGQEAVIVFFVLSGFVIHINEKNRAHNLRAYARRRIYRLYPVLVAALLVSIAISLWDGTFSSRFRLSDAICNLLFLQDRGSLVPGTICNPFLGNSPLWSLSYEAIFYIIYPIVLPLYTSRGRLSQHVIGGCSLIFILLYKIYPQHFLLLPSYFIIWWCGAMLGDSYVNGKYNIRNLAAPVGYLGAACLLWLAIMILENIFVNFGHYPALQFRHFSFAFILVTISFIQPVRSFVRWVGSNYPSGWVWLSSISYGVYALHYPLLVQWNFSRSAYGFMIASGALIMLAYIFDNRANKFLRKKRARS